MWDPRTYRDDDFGLTPDDAFEPGDADTPDLVDLTRPHIMTVLGAIDPDDLGVCLPHERVLREFRAITDGHPDERLDRLDFASQDLEAFVTAGGRSIVDDGTPATGRDRAGLRALAQRIPIHLIATSGHQEAQRYGEGQLEVDAAAVAESIRDDLGGEIKPGLIAFSATDGLTPAPVGVVRGAVMAAAATGYPLVANSGRGGTAHEHLDLIEAAGFDPARVIVAEVTREPRHADLLSIVRREAWVSLDWIGRGRPGDELAEVETILRLAEAGYASQILVSQGLHRRKHFTSYGGGPGWTYLLERFTLDLMAAGAGAAFVRQLVVENPARALSIVPR